MKIKGYVQKKKAENNPSLSGSIDSIIKVVADIQETKKDIIDTTNEALSNIETVLNEKTDEIDTKLSDIKSTVDSKITEIKTASNEIKDAKEEIIENIQKIKKGEDGKPGKNAENIDEKKLIDKIIKQLPTPLDEKTLTKKILAKVPSSKASLKVIQENIEIDPMSVIDKIMALPKEKLAKFQLNTNNISGLSQTMSAFQSQLGRGYLHGGGMSKVITDSTLTGDGTKEKPLHAVGDGIGDMLKATYDPANGAKQVAFADEVLKLDQTTPQTTVGRFNFPNIAVDTDTIYTDSVNHRVGIGTTSPSDNLQVSGIIGAGNNLNTSGGSTVDGEIRSYQSNPVSLYVSLKTASVKSGIYRSNAGFINYFDTSNGSTVMDVPFSNASLLFNTQGNNRMTILTGGNVGIGTTAPDEKLHLHTGNFKIGQITGTNSTSTASQVSSGILKLETSNWTSSVEAKQKWSIQSVASTTTNNRADLVIGMGDTPTTNRAFYITSSAGTPATIFFNKVARWIYKRRIIRTSNKRKR